MEIENLYSFKIKKSNSLYIYLQSTTIIYYTSKFYTCLFNPLKQNHFIFQKNYLDKMGLEPIQFLLSHFECDASTNFAIYPTFNKDYLFDKIISKGIQI